MWGIGAAVVVIAGVGGVMLATSDPSDPSVAGPEKTKPRGKTVRAEKVGRPDARPAPTPGPAPAAKPQKRPPKRKPAKPTEAERADLMTEFARRQAAASTRTKKIALATWCRSRGLTEEARAIVLPLLSRNSKDARLNKLAGHRRFDGEHPLYYGRWLDAEGYAKARRDEKRYLNDPQYEMLVSAVASIKNQYLEDFDVATVMEWPYVVVLQFMGSDRLTAHFRAEKADQTRAFHRAFKATFPVLAAKKLDRPLSIITFRDRKTFLDFTSKRGDDMSGARAFYDPQSRFVYSYEREAKGIRVSHEYLLGVMFHECTHQYLDQLRPRDSLSESVWFEEALAEYFGGSRPLKRDAEGRMQYELGVMNHEQALLAQSAIRAKRHFPLPVMFRCRTYDEANTSYQQHFGVRREDVGKILLYCQGWSFIHFCLNEPSGKFRKRFLAYAREDILGNGDYETLCTCFGIAEDAQWKPVERQWLAFTMKLKPDRGKKRRKPARKTGPKKL